MIAALTWDSVTWTVVDSSGKEIFKVSCGKQCEKELKMFGFKVDVVGKHEYWVEMKKEGEVLTCHSELDIFGMSTFRLFRFQRFHQLRNSELSICHLKYWHSSDRFTDFIILTSLYSHTINIMNFDLQNNGHNFGDTKILDKFVICT